MTDGSTMLRVTGSAAQAIVNPSILATLHFDVKAGTSGQVPLSLADLAGDISGAAPGSSSISITAPATTPRVVQPSQSSPAEGTQQLEVPSAAHLSPAERLAALEVHGEVPTVTLVAEAEGLLRQLSPVCDQDSETIVTTIDDSLRFIYSNTGRRESAMDMANAVVSTAAAFQEHDCVKVVRLIAATEVESTQH